MKLRIEGNAVRVRLSIEDVAQLAKTGAVADCLRFPHGTEFCYCVLAADGDLLAEYVGRCLTLRVPRSLVAEWAASDLVTLCQAVAHGMHLLVEKDLPCRHPGRLEEGR